MVASYKFFYRKIGFVLAALGFLRIPWGLWVAGGRGGNDRTWFLTPPSKWPC